MRNWKEELHDTHYYYDADNGRIVGIITPITHTRIWVARILTEQYNNDIFLGQYISLDFAQKAIEQFWNIQDRTLLNNESI